MSCLVSYCIIFLGFTIRPGSAGFLNPPNHLVGLEDRKATSALRQSIRDTYKTLATRGKNIEISVYGRTHLSKLCLRHI